MGTPKKGISKSNQSTPVKKGTAGVYGSLRVSKSNIERLNRTVGSIDIDSELIDLDDTLKLKSHAKKQVTPTSRKDNEANEGELHEGIDNPNKRNLTPRKSRKRFNISGGEQVAWISPDEPSMKTRNNNINRASNLEVEKRSTGKLAATSERSINFRSSNSHNASSLNVQKKAGKSNLNLQVSKNKLVVQVSSNRRRGQNGQLNKSNRDGTQVQQRPSVKQASDKKQINQGNVHKSKTQLIDNNQSEDESVDENDQVLITESDSEHSNSDMYQPEQEESDENIHDISVKYTNPILILPSRSNVEDANVINQKEDVELESTIHNGNGSENWLDKSTDSSPKYFLRSNIANTHESSSSEQEQNFEPNESIDYIEIPPNGHWTEIEERIFRQGIDEHGNDFDLILQDHGVNGRKTQILSERNLISLKKKFKRLNLDNLRNMEIKGKTRIKWTKEETEALEKGIKKYSKDWEAIIDDDKSKGKRAKLFRRNNMALKDKARSEYIKRMRIGEPLGAFKIMHKEIKEETNDDTLNNGSSNGKQ